MTESHSHDMPEGIFHMGGGPHGLGDPEDQKLRKVESDVIIQKMIKARTFELCVEEVKAFNECGKDAGIMLPFKCRKENKTLSLCQNRCHHDPELFEKCKNEYLAARTLYRQTGVGQNVKGLKSSRASAS